MFVRVANIRINRAYQQVDQQPRIEQRTSSEERRELEQGHSVRDCNESPSLFWLEDISL